MSHSHRQAQTASAQSAAEPATYFAPPERADIESLTALARAAVGDPIVQVVLEAVEGYMLILDEHRQAIAGNEEVLKALGIHSPGEFLGLRPGELLHCENASVGPGGCGTSKRCRKCGAVVTILASQAQGAPADGECSLTMERDGMLRTSEFRVRCTPLTLAGRPITAMVFQDISAEKRKEVLEKVFMHDLRNTLQGLIGYSELITMGDTETASRMILALSNQLNEEVDGQTCLMKAERDELDMRPESLDGEAVLEQVRGVFEHHPASHGRLLKTVCLTTDTHFESDGRLLRRVLVNMVKNALEAVKSGDYVELRFDREDGAPVFSVWNRGAIPEHIASRVFQRSFSTKGESGRGIGTYSMRLIGQQYLGGIVDFISSPDDGTTFSIVLPLTLRHAGAPKSGSV